jgi:hypothetical protein
MLNIIELGKSSANPIISNIVSNKLYIFGFGENKMAGITTDAEGDMKGAEKLLCGLNIVCHLINNDIIHKNEQICIFRK